MNKPDPKSLAVDLLDRSRCNVQVAAVLFDKVGIFSWGWNSVGSGFGLHAEAHALGRANRKRLKNASIAIAGRRRGVVPSLPCEKCRERLEKVGVRRVYIQDREGTWYLV